MGPRRPAGRVRGRQGGTAGAQQRALPLLQLEEGRHQPVEQQPDEDDGVQGERQAGQHAAGQTRGRRDLRAVLSRTMESNQHWKRQGRIRAQWKKQTCC